MSDTKTKSKTNQPNKLVIVESPNKIKSIGKYLGENYEVLASVGHIVHLPSSGEHKFGVDLNTWTPNYQIDPDKKKIVAELKAASKKADEVLVATDPDREGEAIADNLVSFLNIQDKYKRIRFNEITKDAIEQAIQNPTIVDENLVNSQIARRILDRIIGYKLSSLMKSKIFNTPSNPSAGRVQSIALKLVVEREKEIEAFVPVHYSTLEALIDGHDDVSASYINRDRKENKDWILPEEVADVKAKLSGSLKIVEVNISERNDSKLTPLKQAALYKKADSSLGMSSKRIQFAAQKLYEEGLISYPRTDSTRLSSTFVIKSQEYIASTYGHAFLASEIKGVAGAQDAHEAIRPTDLAFRPSMLAAEDKKYTADAIKVYELIWTHTIQALMKVPRREILRYELLDGDIAFRMSSSKLIFQGYHVVHGYEETKQLPKLQEGEILKVKDYVFEDKQTQPTARYNDGSLIEKLDDIKVGRPSTFATTVEILKQRDYVTVDGKALIPTEFGRIVLSKLIESFPDIINEEYTAMMENELDLISEGSFDYKKTLDSFWTKFQSDLQTATTEMSVTKMMPLFAGKKCPVCGNELLIRRNKAQGTTFFGCSGFPKCTHVEADPNSSAPKFKRKFFGKPSKNKTTSSKTTSAKK